VEKTDFEEIMSNPWKKLQILREHANSAKSIENNHKALRAKLDVYLYYIYKKKKMHVFGLAFTLLFISINRFDYNNDIFLYHLKDKNLYLLHYLYY